MINLCFGGKSLSRYNHRSGCIRKLGLSLLFAILMVSFLSVSSYITPGFASADGTNDWPMFHHDLSHSGYSTSTAPNTNQVLWSSTTGYTSSSPAVVGGKVYVGSNDNKVYCLSADNGTLVWSFTTGFVVQSSPAVVDGKVYIGSGDKRVYCLNAADGAFIWSYVTDAGVLSSPAVVDGKVYIGSVDHKVYCLNATDGTRIWSYTAQSYVSSSPAVVDGKVYIGSEDGKVYCLDAENGTNIWNYTTGGSITSPAVANGKVFTGSADNKTYCLNATNGELVWSYTTGLNVFSSPAVAAGKVYFGSNDGKIYCLNATNGLLVWLYTVGPSLTSSPAIADDKVYVGAFDWRVYCLNASTGAFVWSYRTGNAIYSSPAVADGRVYIGSSDNMTYCFGTSSIPTPTPSPSVIASMWDKTYGGTGSDTGTGDTIQTSDGGYAISGDTNSSGAGGWDVWLIKTGAAGNVQWNKTYGGVLDEVSGGMCKTSDGGYAISGYTTSFGAGGRDAWLVRTGADGRAFWAKTYGGAGDDYALNVIQSSDRGYVLTGYTSSFGAGGQDAYIIKTDEHGNMEWSSAFGEKDNDIVYDARQTSDGGYIIAGYTNSSVSHSIDAWLIKLDHFGNMVWNKTYGGTGNDYGYSMAESDDGGYAIFGYTTSFGGYKVYLVKTDASGNMQWNKTYGATPIEIGLHGIRTADGGYAISGWNYANGQDFILIKTDAAGNLQWEMTYGGTGVDNAYALLQSSDGGYVLTGNTNSFGAGGNDIWLVKTDALGAVPEDLTIDVMVLLSAVAVIVSICYFRKQPKIGNRSQVKL
jgi:outer membrane protein assembly factor BamB